MNRSHTSLLLLALSGSLLLAGCNQQAETSVVAPSASEVAAASATAAASAAAQNPSQTLATEDGIISLTVNGRFEDKLAESAQYVDGADSNKISLLQYDADQDIAITVSNFGAPKQPAEAYFAKLSESLKADQGLNDTAVDTPADQRMGYRFSHGQEDNVLNESCVTVYAKNLYTVCATSSTASLPELDALLKNLTVKQ